MKGRSRLLQEESLKANNFWQMNRMDPEARVILAKTLKIRNYQNKWPKPTLV